MTEYSADIAEDRRYAATLSGDVAALNELFHDGLVYGHSTGSADTKTSYIEAVKTGELKYHSIDLRDRVVIDRVEYFLVLCTVAMDVTVARNRRMMKNRVLSVWEKADGGLRLVASHSTPLSPPSGASQ